MWRYIRLVYIARSLFSCLAENKLKCPNQLAVYNPPTLFAGGFGGSSTRFVTQLLSAAGVYMTDRDKDTGDSLTLRGDVCSVLNPEDIYARLETRAKDHTGDLAQVSQSFLWLHQAN